MRSAFLVMLHGLVSFQLCCQDEGPLELKPRFENAKSFAVTIGPEFRFRSKADYSGGYFVSASYLKRLNRIITLGPAISFSRYAFDPSSTNSYEKKGVKGNNVFQDVLDIYTMYVVALRGGDLTQLSIGFDVDLNLKPFNPDQKINLSLVVHPFSMVNHRSAISATTVTWVRNDPDDPPTLWNGGDISREEGPQSVGRGLWATQKEFSGGIQSGLKVMVDLPDNWSLHIQPQLRYTLPISHIKTASFQSVGGNENARFPIVKERFSTISILVGISHHF